MKFLKVFTKYVLILVVFMHMFFCFAINDGVFLYLYFGWKEVEFDNSLRIKVPSDWNMKYDEENDLYFFLDENNKPMMVQTYLDNELFDIDIEKETKEYVIVNEEIQMLFGKITRIDADRTHYLTNGSTFGKVEFQSDEISNKGYGVKVGRENLGKCFIIVDNDINGYDCFRIAHSAGWL